MICPGQVIIVLKKPSPPNNIFFAPFYGLDINGAGLTHSCQVPGINNHLLSGSQVIFNRCAVNFKESRTAAGQLLHNKPLTAKETGSSLFLEKGGKLPPASAARKPDFWTTRPSPGRISTGLIEPGNEEAKAIIPLSLRAV